MEITGSGENSARFWEGCGPPTKAGSTNGKRTAFECQAAKVRGISHNCFRTHGSGTFGV